MSYTAGLSKDTFIADGITYDATLHNIQLIGRAANPVPAHVREAHPEIPWGCAVETQHRLTHGYLDIDDDVVWDIIQTDVPNLLPKLRSLLDSSVAE